MFQLEIERNVFRSVAYDLEISNDCVLYELAGDKCIFTLFRILQNSLYAIKDVAQLIPSIAQSGRASFRMPDFTNR